MLTEIEEGFWIDLEDVSYILWIPGKDFDLGSNESPGAMIYMKSGSKFNMCIPIVKKLCKKLKEIQGKHPFSPQFPQDSDDLSEYFLQDLENIQKKLQHIPNKYLNCDGRELKWRQ